jgi:hypothetical protein
MAKQAWNCLYEFNGFAIASYTDMASKWIAEKKKLKL